MRTEMVKKNVELRKRLTAKFQTMLASQRETHEISIRVDNHKFSIGSAKGDYTPQKNTALTNRTFSSGFWGVKEPAKKCSLLPTRENRTVSYFKVELSRAASAIKRVRRKVDSTERITETSMQKERRGGNNRRLLTIADYIDKQEHMGNKLVKVFPSTAPNISKGSSMKALANVKALRGHYFPPVPFNKRQISVIEYAAPSASSAEKLPKNKSSTPLRPNLLISSDFGNESTDYKELLENLCGTAFADQDYLVECEITKLVPERSYNVLKDCAAFEANYTSTLVPFSKEDIRNITDFFARKTESRSIENIEALLNSRYFFSALRKSQRVHLLKHTTLVSCSKGDVLIHPQETIPELIYIIKGSLRISDTAGEYSRNIKWGQIFADDNYFESDYNQLGYTKHYYDKFCITALADTIVLITSREAFDFIIRKELNNELFQKLYTLKRCKLFQEIPLIQLLLMVNKSSLIVKHYWEVVQRQGTAPRKCYIVSKGLCKAVYEKKAVGSPLPRECIRKYMIKPSTAWRFGDSNATPIENAYYPYKEAEFYASNNSRGVKMQFKYEIDFGIVKEGDYLGGRAFLAGQENSIKEILPSQLTLVANSADAVLLEVPPESLLVLDPRFIVKASIKEKVIENIELEKDRPCPNPAEFAKKIQKAEEWRMYREKVKEKCVLNVVNQRKKRSGFSFMA